MKYFEKNKFDGKPLDRLHNNLGKTHQCVSSNLFFHEANDKADTERHRLILAWSAYMLIAICDAIAECVPDDERKKALEEIRKEIEPTCDDELFRMFIDAVFGE